MFTKNAQLQIKLDQIKWLLIKNLFAFNTAWKTGLRTFQSSFIEDNFNPIYTGAFESFSLPPPSLKQTSE